MIKMTTDAWRSVPFWLRLSLSFGVLITAATLALTWWLASPLHGNRGLTEALLVASVALLGGWAFLVRHAICRVSQQIKVSDNETISLVQRETQAVLDYLAEEFQKQFEYADRELSQTQELLRDAIDTLTASFSNIYGGLNAQQTLAKAIGKESTVQSDDADVPAPDPHDSESEPAEGSPKAVEKVLAISYQLDIDINTAIRTLQFQDLTNQLIGHAVHRISAMNNALSDIKSVNLEGEDGARDFIDYLYQHREAILKKVANLDERKTNPVSQGHMGTGDIDLF